MHSIEEENERQYRVIDQMLTMHAVLRDRYNRRALYLNLILLVGAIVLNAFVFASEIVSRLLSISLEHARDAIGFISVLLLAASIVEYRVNWAGQSRSHKDAVDRLGTLKCKYREYNLRRQELGTTHDEELSGEYGFTMGILPPIPEKQFNRLKSCHLLKKLVSEEISKNPRVPMFLIVLRLRLQGIRDFMTRGNRPQV